ncbi:hypothetical protein TRIUR3_21507 [Triticum urartu]|uniref:Uncharacterized protein n=1 Tax=Triticum urartu TaxID=4572 RepID=M7YG36_TRIUA|nr:hypothetical protein TRIUR3_21507 [Triticum urartu]
MALFKLESLADMYCMQMIMSKMQGHKKPGMQKDQDTQIWRGPWSSAGPSWALYNGGAGLQAKIEHVNVGIYILGPHGAAAEVDHMHFTEVGVLPVLHSA